MAYDDKPYEVSGNSKSEQAEASSANRAAASTQMRILIELQVLTMLIHQAFESTEDLAKLRQNVGNSIT